MEILLEEVYNIYILNITLLMMNFLREAEGLLVLFCKSYRAFWLFTGRSFSRQSYAVSPYCLHHFLFKIWADLKNFLASFLGLLTHVVIRRNLQGLFVFGLMRGVAEAAGTFEPGTWNGFLRSGNERMEANVLTAGHYVWWSPRVRGLSAVDLIKKCLSYTNRKLVKKYYFIFKSFPVR